MQFESPFEFPTVIDRINGAVIEEIRHEGYKPEYLKENINKEVYDEATAYNYINEAHIKRSEVDPKDFGLPDQKKYPMPDAAHVKSAIKFFNHVDPGNEKELAKNIKKKMKEYNITDISIGDKNRFSKYYKSEEKKKAVLEHYHGEPNSYLVFESLIFDNDEPVQDITESDDWTTMSDILNKKEGE